MATRIRGRRGLVLNVRIAYPGILGAGLPVPPDGYVAYSDGRSAMNKELRTISFDGAVWRDSFTGDAV